MRRWVIAVGLLILPAAAGASDIPALEPLTSENVETVCPASCRAHGCGWSGEWRKEAGGGVCDCGTERVRRIPGGHPRTREEAAEICTEICTMNADTWDGTLQAVAGGFPLCGCLHVAEWCEPKK